MGGGIDGNGGDTWWDCVGIVSGVLETHIIST